MRNTLNDLLFKYATYKMEMLGEREKESGKDSFLYLIKLNDAEKDADECCQRSLLPCYKNLFLGNWK